MAQASHRGEPRRGVVAREHGDDEGEHRSHTEHHPDDDTHVSAVPIRSKQSEHDEEERREVPVIHSKREEDHDEEGGRPELEGAVEVEAEDASPLFLIDGLEKVILRPDEKRPDARLIRSVLAPVVELVVPDVDKVVDDCEDHHDDDRDVPKRVEALGELEVSAFSDGAAGVQRQPKSGASRSVDEVEQHPGDSCEAASKADDDSESSSEGKASKKSNEQHEQRALHEADGVVPLVPKVDPQRDEGEEKDAKVLPESARGEGKRVTEPRVLVVEEVVIVPVEVL